ncbi:MAG: discoidin domain-containing protein [Akkermansiaceae bacterium]|nr:discoidin domain-containing protein [Akkermansiaceae bacterium]
MKKSNSIALLPGLAAAVAAFAFAFPAHAVEKTFTHYRWTPTKLRDNTAANSIQVAEFQFIQAGSPVSWTGVTVTNPGGSNPGGQTPLEIIDGVLSTKWLDFNKWPGLVFSFSAPTTIDSYRFATGGDAIERDPLSWNLEGSDDQFTWTFIDIIKDFPVTTDRQAWVPTMVIPENLVPEILIFEPSGVVVKDGGSHDFSWDIERADTAVIDNSVGPVDAISGWMPIDPPDNADSLYTLTASSSGGVATAAVNVRSVTGGTLTTRYVRFSPRKLRGTTVIQLAEFSFFDDTTMVVPVDVTNPGGSNTPDAGEGALKAIDNDVYTKWLDGNMQPLVFDFGAVVNFDRYLITTANDSSERDPLRWIMEASDDGSTWTMIENMTAFDYNMPIARYTDSESIPFPGPSLVPILTGSSDFASMLIGESVDLSWDSTGAATVTGDNGLGSLGLSGTTTVSPTADTTYTLTATAAGGRTQTVSLFIQVADPTVTGIAYENFDIAGSEINLRASATVLNALATLPQGGDVKRLRLTPDLNSAQGAAWFRYKQDLSEGFDTTFGFQFTSAQTTSGADGMAFVIHNDARKTEAMPATLHEFGMEANALNICFDSYNNWDVGETSAARLLVRSGSTTLAAVNLAAVAGLTLFTTDQGADLSDLARTGNPFQVHASYTPGALDVSINGILVVDSLDVDLGTIGALDGENKAYVGFTARTGGAFEAHDVTHWTFTPGTPVIPGYADWIGGFSGLADSTEGADPDLDGISNLVEYVLNGDPGVSSPAILPTVGADVGDNLVFSFVRRAESRHDTVQVFQASPDLENWTDTPVPNATAGMFVITPTSPSSGLETVTVTVPAAAAAAGKLFGRLHVTGQ